MDIWQIDKLLLFLIFFIPGFLSVKIYDLLVPGERRDFSKSLVEVIGYSCINFAALSWLIILIHSNNFYTNYRVCYIIIVVLILFIFPILWPPIFLKILSLKFIAKYVINPIPKPWDYIFSKREAFWVIVNLQNGERIGGIYDKNSYTSSYPVEEQIYLEEVWTLDENGKFIEPIKRSNGILIMDGQISSIEFFR
ncbi:MAG: DUF6338 family protein [bacterium]